MSINGQSIVVGEPQALVAVVTPIEPGGGSPTGTVNFYDGNNLLGSVQLSQGTATLVTGGVGIGTRTITATFQGSGDFIGSQSNPVLETVGASYTTTTLTSVVATVYGQSATFTANIAAVAPSTGIPTGLVLFVDGLNPLGSANLDSNGKAQLTISSLGLGMHQIKAIYAGDTLYQISTSPAAAMTVSKASATVVLTSTSASILGQAPTLKATVGVASETIVTPGWAFHQARTESGAWIRASKTMVKWAPR